MDISTQDIWTLFMCLGDVKSLLSQPFVGERCVNQITYVERKEASKIRLRKVVYVTCVYLIYVFLNDIHM